MLNNQMYSKHLPHIDLPNHYQFITYRTHDSVDAFIKKIQNRKLTTSEKQLAIDEYLDTSQQGTYLKDGVLTKLMNFIRAKDKSLYDLVAVCIMPNHVHLLVKPLDQLPKIMHRIKGGSAKMINEQLKRTGQFWETNYYDKLIRDQKHFNVVYQYIKSNPLKLHEADALQTRFYGIYENS